MSNEGLPDEQGRFADEVARLLVPWGVPQTAARLYGYLLLRDEPVSLDRITADLRISKSNASVAARLLETYMLARRHGERGSKRALYAVSDRYEEMMAEQKRLLAALEELLRAGRRMTEAKPTRARLKEMAEFYETMRVAMDTAMDRWRDKHRG